MQTMIGPYYMDTVYNCRDVSHIDVIDNNISKVCIDWDYKNERILVRSLKGWGFLEYSNLTIGQVIQKIGYNNYFVQVMWAVNGNIIDLLDIPVKSAPTNIIRLYKK